MDHVNQSEQVNSAEVLAFFACASVRVAHNAVYAASERGMWVLRDEAKQVVGNPPPSVQGGPPAKQTGALQTGLDAHYSHQGSSASITLTTGQKYGLFLDKGFRHHWSNKFVWRPFSETALARMKMRLKGLMPDFLREAILEEVA